MKTTRPRMLPALVALALSCGGCVIVLDFYEDHDATGSTGSTGSTGASGSGGAGGAGACTPGAIVACYEGPAETEGVGLCKPGSKTCAANGASFGPCESAISPQMENCATPVDEDCDGLAPSCKGAFSWAERFGDTSNQTGVIVAADKAGNVIVAGSFSGTVDFGGGPLISAGSNDVFVAKLDASGGHLWSKRFGDGSEQIAKGIAVDSAGNVFVAGSFSGTMSFGSGDLTSAGSNDVFVAKLDASGGHLWSKSFGDGKQQIARSIAVDSAGNVLVAGGFSGTVDFGGGALTSAGADDVFVAKLDASGGGHLWSKRFGDASQQAATSVAVDSAGEVFVVGLFGSMVDFGGGALTSAGSNDVFVAKLDASGGHLWSKSFGDADQQDASGVAVDSAGNVVITGEFFGTVDFGGGALTSAGNYDLFLAKFDASGGHLWSKRFGDDDDQGGAPSVAIDASGNVLAAGTFHGVLDFGGGPVVSAGGEDAYLTKLDASGGYLWSKRFGSAMDEQAATSVAVDASNNVLLAGYFGGSLDFGGGSSLMSAGGYDLYIAKFSE